MSYTALARKWRPRRFEELTGQEHVVRALVNALTSGRVHHAFLFTGTRGVGKTTIARIFAKCLNCDTGVVATPCGVCSACREIDEGRFVDLLEVDAASRTRIDDTRELLDNVQYAPARGRYKVYLIDEVHMLSGHSFNALLKTLEEPPPHVKFLLATTDPQKLPITVLSRCLQFNLKRIPVPRIAERMRQILDAEKIPAEAPALQLLAAAADGSLRDALSLLDQLIAFGGGKVSTDAAASMLGAVDRQHPQRIVESLAAGDAPAIWAVLAHIAELGIDAAEMLDATAALLARVALRQSLPDYSGDDLHPAEMLAKLALSLPAEDVQLYYQIAINGRRDLDWAPDPATGLEMTFLRMLAFRPGDTVESGPASPPVTAQRPGVVPGGAPNLGVPPVSGASPGGAAAIASDTPVGTQSAGEPAGGADAPGGWSAMLSALGLSGPTRQLAANCVLLGIHDGVVRLKLDPQGRHLRTNTLTDKLAAALARHLGSTVRLEFEIAEAGALDTPARAELRASEAALEQARDSIENDPTVRALREKFGAQVQPATVRPRH